MISIFTWRILHSQGCTVSSCGQRRRCSDSADAQAGLNLCWAHMSKGTFSHVAVQIFSQAGMALLTVDGNIMSGCTVDEAVAVISKSYDDKQHVSMKLELLPKEETTTM